MYGTANSADKGQNLQKVAIIINKVQKSEKMCIVLHKTTKSAHPKYRMQKDALRLKCRNHQSGEVGITNCCFLNLTMKQ